MVAGKDDGNIEGRGVTTIVSFMGFVIFPVNIHVDATLDRHVWATHHTVSLVHRLSSTYTYCRVVSRLDFDFEAFTSMWQSIIHLLQVSFC